MYLVLPGVVLLDAVQVQQQSPGSAPQLQGDALVDTLSHLTPKHAGPSRQGNFIYKELFIHEADSKVLHIKTSNNKIEK